MTDVRILIGDVECSEASVAALARVDRTRTVAARARDELAVARRAAVVAMVRDGGSYRAIARLLVISYQRVGQIVDAARADGTLPPADRKGST